MSFLEKDSRYMPELRSIEWDDCLRAFSLIIENPMAEKGYSDLKNFYLKFGMNQNAETIGFLTKNRFYDHDPDFGSK